HAARRPCRRLLRDDHRGAEGHRHPRLPPVPRRPLFPTGSQPRNTRVRLTDSPLLFSNSSIVMTHPHQPDLRAIATRAMIARGFIVQFPSDAQQQTRSEAEPRFDSYKATDLSSLNENENRLAVVMEVLVSDDGRIVESAVYPAIVRNQSQLTYDSVAAWLEEKPGNHLSEASQRTLRKIANSAELQSQLRL